MTKCAYCNKKIKGIIHNIDNMKACKECFNYWEHYSLAGKVHAKIHKSKYGIPTEIEIFSVNDM